MQHFSSILFLNTGLKRLNPSLNGKGYSLHRE